MLVGWLGLNINTVTTCYARYTNDTEASLNSRMTRFYLNRFFELNAHQLARIRAKEKAKRKILEMLIDGEPQLVEDLIQHVGHSRYGQSSDSIASLIRSLKLDGYVIESSCMAIDRAFKFVRRCYRLVGVPKSVG